MSQILVERRDGVATVTLNRPEKRNALSPEMIVRLAQFWREVAQEDAIRAIVVTGAGDQAFSSGGDLGALIPLMMQHPRAAGRVGGAVRRRPQAARRGAAAQRQLLQARDRRHQRPCARGRRRVRARHRPARDVERSHAWP